MIFLKKVLVVDDTKNIRNLLTTCLELNGYTVLTANNGLSAIEFITKESFDIAFIDIKMPELSGTEVLRRIRALGFVFPVVIMTAYATVKNAVECTKLGAVAYLQKPFTADKVNDLLAKLEEVTSHAESINEYLNKAKLQIEEKLYDEALKCLELALSLDSSRGEIYFLIGKIYQLENNLVLAQKYFETAKIFDNNNDKG
jgi:two-component system, OmpR family, response regulator